MQLEIRLISVTPERKENCSTNNNNNNNKGKVIAAFN
jgi:hypothetical protein